MENKNHKKVTKITKTQHKGEQYMSLLRLTMFIVAVDWQRTLVMMVVLLFKIVNDRG